MVTDKIYLNNISGMGRLSGVDEHGNSWIEFEVDYFAEQIDGECDICGEELTYGWMCLDGGEEVCEDHVIDITIW